MLRLCTTLAVVLQVEVRGALLRRLQQLATESPSEAAQALLALDVNKDGVVGFDEVAQFAKTKGLDYIATLTEFSSYDADRNGMLDAKELAVALGFAPSSEPVAVQKQVPPSQTLTNASHVVPVFQQLRQQVASLEEARPSAMSSAQVLASGTQNGSRLPSSFLARSSSLAKVAENLAVEARKEHEAVEFDRQATQLRAKATAIWSQAAQTAREESSKAAKAKAEEIFYNLSFFESEATKGEVQAATLRVQAEAENHKVNDLTAIAGAGLVAGQAQQQ